MLNQIHLHQSYEHESVGDESDLTILSSAIVLILSFHLVGDESDLTILSSKDISPQGSISVGDESDLTILSSRIRT